MEDANRSIHWSSLVLIAGMLPLADALQATGGTQFIVDALLLAVGDSGPYSILTIVFFLTAGLGLVLSNTALGGARRTYSHLHGGRRGFFTLSVCRGRSDRGIFRMFDNSIDTGGYICSRSRPLPVHRFCQSGCAASDTELSRHTVGSAVGIPG